MEVVAGTATVDDVDAFVETLGEIGDDHDCVVQALDARYVTALEHLETAVRYAARAHRRDDAIVRDPAVEILLYAAGRRQIDRALAMGVDAGETPAVVVLASDFPDDVLATDDAEAATATAVSDVLDDARLVDSTGTPEDPDGFGPTDVERVRAFFDVGDAELAATDATLAALVRERVVLLSIDH
jgi:KEOPS complex subunit Cgi121